MQYEIAEIKWGSCGDSDIFRYYAELQEVNPERLTVLGTKPCIISATLDYIVIAVKERGHSVVNIKQAERLLKSRPKESKWCYPEVIQSKKDRIIWKEYAKEKEINPLQAVIKYEDYLTRIGINVQLLKRNLV